MKLQTYKCDRCSKVFELKEDVAPAHIALTWTGEEEDDKEEYDLCEDCEYTFAKYLDYVDEFDKLALKLAREEEEEEKKEEGVVRQ